MQPNGEFDECEDCIIAHHEAGHAVAAYIMQRHIDKVAISGLMVFSGHTARQNNPLLFRPEAIKEILIILAGAAAEIRFCGDAPYFEPMTTEDIETDRTSPHPSDWYRATQIIELLEESHSDPDSFLEQMQSLAFKLIGYHNQWKAVQNLARELVKHKEIEGEAAEHIIEIALGRSSLCYLRSGYKRYNKAISKYLMPDPERDFEPLIEINGRDEWDKIKAKLKQAAREASK